MSSTCLVIVLTIQGVKLYLFPLNFWSIHFPGNAFNCRFVFCVKRQEVVLLENEITFNDAIIEEREQGIKEVQQQISEVNEIFKDLADLVHVQGAMIGKTCVLCILPVEYFSFLLQILHVLPANFPSCWNFTLGRWHWFEYWKFPFCNCASYFTS